MTIAFTSEKNSKLTSQDIYDIIHFAAQSAEDNGFVNQFVFDRALYAYAAIILYPERKAEIGRMISENILDAWNVLLEDGTVEDMYDKYQTELNLLADNGAVWLTDYVKYLQSARGVFSIFQAFSGDIVNSSVKRFKDAFSENDAQDVLDIVDKWGMNNSLIEDSKLKEKVKVKAMATPEQVHEAIRAATEFLTTEETENTANENLQTEDGPLFEL